MMLNLIVLCLAAFAIVATTVSVMVWLALPWFNRIAARIDPRSSVHMWLGLAVLPAAIAIVAVVVSFLPILGIGHDHCLVHGNHHPHLCIHHVTHAPGILLVFVAALLALRAMYLLARLFRDLYISLRTSAELAEVCDHYPGALVFPAMEPQAFVIGALRPRVYLSRGLLALGREVVEPVLAHEQVHTRKHDLLWRLLCPLVAIGHVPGVASALSVRLATHQEMAADAEAATTLANGRLRIAEALIKLAQLYRAPFPGISFVQGNIQARVHALLEEHKTTSVWPAHILLVCALAVTVTLGFSHDLVHHALETVLGTLS